MFIAEQENEGSDPANGGDDDERERARGQTAGHVAGVIMEHEEAGQGDNTGSLRSPHWPRTVRHGTGHRRAGPYA